MAKSHSMVINRRDGRFAQLSAMLLMTCGGGAEPFNECPRLTAASNWRMSAEGWLAIYGLPERGDERSVSTHDNCS